MVHRRWCSLNKLRLKWFCLWLINIIIKINSVNFRGLIYMYYLLALWKFNRRAFPVYGINIRLKFFSLKRLIHPYLLGHFHFLHFIYFQTIVLILSKFSSDASTYRQFLKSCALPYPGDAYPVDVILPSPHSGPCHLVGGRNDPARCQPIFFWWGVERGNHYYLFFIFL